MPKSKTRKNHKQKVNARNNEIKIQKERAQKMQKEFIMNLIKQEQEKGMFNNVPSDNGPIIDGPMINGPSISFDGDFLELSKNNVIDIKSEEVKKD